jgi:enoyl-CoA hydratase
MATDYLYLERKGEIGTIFFNRPEKRNAFNLEMWKGLGELLEEADQDPGIKVLVLRGVDHTAFAAGADISEFKEYRTSAERAEKYNKVSGKAMEALNNFRKPIIAMIQNYCIGGGCGIAVACDFRFSDTNGVFAITPSKLGLVYSLSAAKHVVDLVGPSNGKYILMSGEKMDVQRAYEIGLVDKVYTPEEIEEQTYKFAEVLCSRAQFTVRSMKRIVKLINEGQVKDNDETNGLILESYDTEDYKEGIKAFMEKRKPNFKYS